MKKLLPTTRRPDITFQSNGQIHITSRVASILNITPGSCINIAIHNGEYLLMAENHRMIGRHAARCYPVNKGGRYFRANSIRLCRAILAACGADTRASLMCGQPITINHQPHLPIITATIL